MLEKEQNLIEEAQNGQEAAFGQLYDHYMPRIYRFIYLKIDNRAEAEDLAHETFLSAWKNIHSYKSQGFPFSSWLYQIARNKVIDRYRTHKANLSLEEMDEEALGVVASTAEYSLDTALSLEKVQKGLKALTHEQQDVLIMRFVEELSPKEIAEAIGKNEGAVRVIQHRALNALKKYFEEEHEV